MFVPPLYDVFMTNARLLHSSKRDPHVIYAPSSQHSNILPERQVRLSLIVEAWHPVFQLSSCPSIFTSYQQDAFLYLSLDIPDPQLNVLPRTKPTRRGPRQLS